MQDIQPPGFQPLSNLLAIALPKKLLAKWCDRWKVQELYLFDSVLQDDFRPEDSDIDFPKSYGMSIQRFHGTTWQV